jgi:hypothetical protein
MMSNFRNLFSKRDRTYLGVGPMSKNCVDAVIELTKEYRAPIILVASRRQIECMELGGGYANNWDTFSFAQYVKERDPDGLVVLARDHGGPWQHPNELKRFSNVADAIESSKISYLRDIEAGFQILHIDPVINIIAEDLPKERILEMIFELYSYCMDVSHNLGREVLIEIGTEEQQVKPLDDPANLESLLMEVKNYCDAHQYPLPLSIVVQTGTKVMETRNIGDFPAEEGEIEGYIEKHKLKEIIGICDQYGIMLKQHNTDYLPDSSLNFHPKIGIHSVNVAPEFGVIETIELLAALSEEGMDLEREVFIEICLNSKRWEKWVLPESNLSDFEKAKLCGHYIFMDEKVREIKNKLSKILLKKKGEDLEIRLKNKIKKSIYRYLYAFNQIH